ncbi:MAG: hypothetical protein JXB17_13095 [Bacteroidales bacterium]|nr:hypothetical protein [Bacteroidales bacterium]
MNTEIMKKQNIILSQLNKKTGFKVPEGYFDSLSDNIIKKINHPQLTKQKVFFLSRNIFKYAASFIGFVFILFSAYYFYSIRYNPEVTTDDIALYLNSQGYEVSETDYLSASKNSENEVIKNSELSDEDVIDYLLTENIDYYTIINELY